MELPRSSSDRIRRPWPRLAPDSREADLHTLTEEVEEGLRDIDFEDVTMEDRITFVEYAVAWQVRRALRRGRFDLALQLQRFGAERIALLYERTHGWRPILLYGVPSARGRDTDWRG